MKKQYNKTITACFIGYIVQAIVNNFTPLLFLFFQKCYHIPISQITLLVTFNFGIQLLVDLLSVRFVDKIGYRPSMIIAYVLAAAGLLLLTVLPEILPVSFIGILIAVMIYAIGGGLSAGIMWPGTFSKASATLPKGGTAMFALLALGGDIGCSGGPTLVGMVSGTLGDNLKMGILAGSIFPVLLLIGIVLCRRQKEITNDNIAKSRR